MNVLITGGSGFIGKSILARLALNESYETVYILIRPNQRLTAEERVEKLLTEFLPPHLLDTGKRKFKAVAGDLTKVNLGLSDQSRQMLFKQVHQILHVGASTDLSAPIEVARLINVEGTRRVLEFAHESYTGGYLQRLEYVSTAFVAGIQKGVVKETDLVRGQSFANGYEQSKYECELLVEEYRKKFPIAIYRPSIVVGDSTNGYTTHFKVLYWPIKVLAKQIKGFIVPMSLRSRVDLVPVDFVAGSIVALMQDPVSIGRNYHLTAGKGEEQYITKIGKDSSAVFDVKCYPFIPTFLYRFIQRTPLRKLISEDLWSLYDMFEAYLLYFKGSSARFDNQKTLSALSKYGIQSPKWNNYKGRIFSYCLDTRFGKIKKRAEYEYYLDAVYSQIVTGSETVKPVKGVRIHLVKSEPTLVPSIATQK